MGGLFKAAHALEIPFVFDGAERRADHRLRAPTASRSPT